MWTWNDFQLEASSRIVPDKPLTIVGVDYDGKMDELSVGIGDVERIGAGQDVMTIWQGEGTAYGQDLLDALNQIVDYYGSGSEPVAVTWFALIPKSFFGLPLKENKTFECRKADISWGEDEDNALILSGCYSERKDSVQSSLSSV